MSELKEKCAVSAFVGNSPDANASIQVYDMLYSLQHRGVEASGIVSSDTDGEGFEFNMGPGLVRDVHHAEAMHRLVGDIAIGHNRYSTNGDRDKHLQPVVDEHIGFAQGTNGNLPIRNHLQTFLDKNHIRTDGLNDSEESALAVAQHIRNGQELPDAIELSSQLIRGSYSTVSMHDGVVVAFRDPKGIRPLELGETSDGYAVASETCGLGIIGAEHLRSVEPGEMVIITPDGIESRNFAEGEEKLDLFEFVYFARPDSKLYGQSVGAVRRKSGEMLAEEHSVLGDMSEDTLVVPVPETAIHAAEGLQTKLGFSLSNSIVKNRYIGRSFMLPGQATRKQNLRRKHSFIDDRISGRDIIIVDDSIVRLNTAPRLVEQAHALGAKTVSLLIASPPVRFPDFYGIDTPSQSELAAANMTVEQIREKIGCEYLGFLSLGGLINATEKPESSFNLSCFTGEYPIRIGKFKDEIKTPVEMTYVD